MKLVTIIRNLSRQRWAGFIVLALLGMDTARAAGEVMVYPTRVVFEGGRRSAQVEVINAGSETVTYRVAFENKRMTEAGQFENIPVGTAGPYAESYVRFSPRQMTLAPGASQIVRLYLRKPSALPIGEYRSHLAIRAVPLAKPIRASTSATEDKTLHIQLTPVFGVTLPVIVRQGALDARVDIASLSLRNSTDRNPGWLRVQLRRTGNRSVYGDIAVRFTSPNGTESVIGRAGGVAVYTPNATRTLFVPLTKRPQDLHGGRLRVTYRAQPEEGGATLAETAVRVR